MKTKTLYESPGLTVREVSAQRVVCTSQPSAAPAAEPDNWVEGNTDWWNS